MSQRCAHTVKSHIVDIHICSVYAYKAHCVHTRLTVCLEYTRTVYPCVLYVRTSVCARNGITTVFVAQLTHHTGDYCTGGMVDTPHW